MNHPSNASTPPNPFPPTAVASVGRASRVFTIETSALREGLAYVDSYCEKRAGDGSRVAGLVVAVSGGFGAGKTHLALELAERARDSIPNAMVLFLDAPSDSFLALYQERFLPRLTLSAVRNQVLRCFELIVADELEKSELTSPVAHHIRAKDLTGPEAVERFGLMGSELHQELRLKLSEVTRRTDMGSVLACLIQPELESMAWDWLSGRSEPDDLLVLGVDESINSDAAALDAISSLVHLWNATGDVFVIVLDEMEKLASDQLSEPSSDVAISFKRFVEVVLESGGLLVLSGLPSFLAQMPQDMRDRISVHIPAVPVDDSWLKAYIRRSLGRGPARRESLGPFSRSVISRIVQLSEGNPRRAIRLCYHAFEESRKLEGHAGGHLQPQHVDMVFREHFIQGGMQELSDLVRRTFYRLGFVVESPSRMEGNSELPPDYWATRAVSGELSSGAGIFVFVHEAVLTRDDLDRLRRRLEPWRGEEGGRTVLVVVSGRPPSDLEGELLGVADRVAIVGPHGAEGEIEAAVVGLMARLDSAMQERQDLSIQRAIEALISNQASSHVDLAARISDIANGSQDSFRSTRTAMEVVLSGSASGVVAGRSSALEWRTHPSATYVFEDVLSWVVSMRMLVVSRLDAAFDDIAESSSGKRSRRRTHGPRPPKGLLALAGPESVSGVGSLTCVETLVRAFQNAVNVEFAAGNPYRDGERETRLTSLCERFDVLVERMDLQSVDVLTSSGVLEDVLPPGRFYDVQMLGRRVYDALRVDLDRAEQSGW